MMVVVDVKSGNVLTTLPIGGRVDGTVYDPVLMRAYSSNGEGSLTVVQETGKRDFKVLEQFPTQLGARTITVDTKTHHLFLPTAEFNPPPAATSDQPHPRPTMKPNSFVILEVAPSGLDRSESLDTAGTARITQEKVKGLHSKQCREEKSSKQSLNMSRECSFGPWTQK